MYIINKLSNKYNIKLISNSYNLINNKIMIIIIIIVCRTCWSSVFALSQSRMGSQMKIMQQYLCQFWILFPKQHDSE